MGKGRHLADNAAAARRTAGIEVSKDSLDIFVDSLVAAFRVRNQAGEDDGHSGWPLGPHNALDEGEFDLEHIAVEEEQGAQRLVLRGGRDAPLDGQVREELPVSSTPISFGWRWRWKRTKRLIQSEYAFSVLMLKWRRRAAERTPSSSFCSGMQRVSHQSCILRSAYV
jgi:hypothetical protein